MKTMYHAGNFRQAILCTALAALVYTPIASAAILYGDFSDVPPGGVMYLDVTESSFFPEDEPLFGPPSIAADTLDFDPTIRFVSFAQNALDDVTAGALTFDMSGSGVAITSLNAVARGVYSLSGNGTDATVAAYTNSVTQVSVIEVDGVPVPSPLVLPGLDLNGAFDLSSGATNDAPWMSTLSYDVNAALTAANVPFQFGATRLAIGLNVSLSTASQTASIAEISATDYVFRPTTVVVPEPASMSVFGLALAAAGLLRRRSTF